MPKLLLIRHCQSIGTHPDVPLSEAGAKAAEALITRRSRPACRFAEPDHRAPGGESLNQTKQRAIAALTDIAAAGHRLPAVSSHRNLVASVLRSMDTAFGFEQLLDLRTPDLFEVELDAGRPVRFVRLDALRRSAGQ
jgi:broad specificity phosphatase PhoE